MAGASLSLGTIMFELAVVDRGGFNATMKEADARLKKAKTGAYTGKKFTVGGYDVAPDAKFSDIIMKDPNTGVVWAQ